jgi:hypothetical protein
VTACRCQFPAGAYPFSCPHTGRTRMTEGRHRQCATQAGYFEAMGGGVKKPEPAESGQPLAAPSMTAAGCGGCNKRKTVMNSIVPQSGDMVEAITKATGIKAAVDHHADRKRAARRLRWSYGVTCVPSRFQTTLPRTLASLSNAGFEKPRLFVDGHANVMDLPRYVYDAGLEVTLRSPKVGAFGNWMLALWELYVREPASDRYAIFQDDFVTYRHLRRYLDWVRWPEKGYLNLLTFMQNEGHIGGEVGWYESNQLGRGAVALVFDRDGVWNLLTSKGAAHKPAATKRSTSNIDGFVSDAMRGAGYKEYVHGPSLVQHTGVHDSAIGNKVHPLANTFLGEGFDCLEWLPEHVRSET